MSVALKIVSPDQRASLEWAICFHPLHDYIRIHREDGIETNREFDNYLDREREVNVLMSEGWTIEIPNMKGNSHVN